MDKSVQDIIQSIGLLLLQDKTLKSVVGIVTGEAVSGSWWGHPRGKEIYAVVQQLTERVDILTCKLIEGKVTFVHKSKWDALFSLTSGKEAWQETSSDVETWLVEFIRKMGFIRLVLVDYPDHFTAASVKKAADQLERKLLIYSEQIHTEDGHHSRVLKSWKTMASTRGYVPPHVDVLEACASLEQAVQLLGDGTKASVKLPWGKMVLE